MTTEIYDKYGRRVYLDGIDNTTKGGAGQTIFIAIATAVTLVTGCAMYQIYQIHSVGKDTTWNNMFKTSTQLNAKTDKQVMLETREQEREFYYNEAVKHYSETYAIKHARTLALKDTNAFFAARDKGREAALKQDNALIDSAEDYVEKGGFIKNISYLLDSPNVDRIYENEDVNIYKPLPKNINIKTTISEEVDIDMDAMKKRNKEVILENKSKNRRTVVGKYTIPSSLPANIGSGRKVILHAELNQKQVNLATLQTQIQRADNNTANKLKAEINRVNGDINALQQEIKM